MNYAVYTYQVIDGLPVCQIIAYKMTQDAQGVNGFHLMTQVEAQALADSMGSSAGSPMTKMVLPLEPDQAITAV